MIRKARIPGKYMLLRANRARGITHFGNQMSYCARSAKGVVVRAKNELLRGHYTLGFAMQACVLCGIPTVVNRGRSISKPAFTLYRMVREADIRYRVRPRAVSEMIHHNIPQRRTFLQINWHPSIYVAPLT